MTSWTTPTSFTSLSYFTKTKGDTQLIDNLTHLGDEHLHSGVSGEGAGTLTVADGSVSAPSYAFLNDTDCGFYRIGANNIGMSIGGTKLLDLSSAAFAVTGSIAATTTIKSSGATSGIGYATGAGGTVTQITSKSTSVTLNKVCGQITTHNAALGAGASVVFQLANSTISATDTLIVHAADNAATDNVYRVEVIMLVSGGANLRLTNTSGGSLSEAVLINFAVIKAVTS